MSFVTILQLIVALSTKIPSAVKLLMDLYELFKPEIEKVVPGGVVLDSTEISLEEQELTDKISLALSTDGTLSVIDFSRLRALVKFLNDSGLASVIEKILRRAQSQ